MDYLWVCFLIFKQIGFLVIILLLMSKLNTLWWENIICTIFGLLKFAEILHYVLVIL